MAAYNPKEIYLFGSTVWGKPDEQSDLDVLVVVGTSREKPHRRVLKALEALKDLPMPKDILVFTEEEFYELSRDTSSLCHKVKNEGFRLYEAA